MAFWSPDNWPLPKSMSRNVPFFLGGGNYWLLCSLLELASGKDQRGSLFKIFQGVVDILSPAQSLSSLATAVVACTNITNAILRVFFVYTEKKFTENNRKWCLGHFFLEIHGKSQKSTGMVFRKRRVILKTSAFRVYLKLFDFLICNLFDLLDQILTKEFQFIRVYKIRKST